MITFRFPYCISCTGAAAQTRLKTGYNNEIGWHAKRGEIAIEKSDSMARCLNTRTFIPISEASFGYELIDIFVKCFCTMGSKPTIAKGHPL